MRDYFYFKEKRKIVPFVDKATNEIAKQKLDTIFSNRESIGLPARFVENWDKVSLYHPSGNIEKANAVIIDANEGAYALDNKLNHYTGKEWIKFSCSWFVFNALPEDIRAEKELDPKIEEHPATFSPTMIESFIKFFTKEGQSVIDPFLGIGSTLEACKRSGRIGYGVELSEKYYKLSLKRTPEFKNNIFNDNSLNIDKLKLPEIDFAISSPPYWDILNRSTHDFKKNREKSNLDVKYSESDGDIGNIDDYEKFLDSVCEIYLNLYKVLKKGAYNVIIVKNIKKGSRMYPLAWDIASRLSKTYVLKDEKIWIQDKAGLAPFGYPYSWASNILHNYCIILRKE
ncbi:MAG: DNA methyltransferase [bacterium]